MSIELEHQKRREIFRVRKRVRDCTRAAYIANDGDPRKTQQQAEEDIKDEYGSIVMSIFLAVIVNLVAGWIADFIRDWNNRGIRIPLANYQPEEPGYFPEFEDDET